MIYKKKRVQLLSLPIARHKMQPRFIIPTQAAGSGTCGAPITLWERLKIFEPIVSAPGLARNNPAELLPHIQLLTTATLKHNKHPTNCLFCLIQASLSPPTSIQADIKALRTPGLREPGRKHGGQEQPRAENFPKATPKGFAEQAAPCRTCPHCRLI